MSARERARLSQSDPEYAPREPDWLTNQDNEREIGSQTDLFMALTQSYYCRLA